MGCTRSRSSSGWLLGRLGDSSDIIVHFLLFLVCICACMCVRVCVCAIPEDMKDDCGAGAVLGTEPRSSVRTVPSYTLGRLSSLAYSS